MITLKQFKRIINESINRVISENNLHVIDNQIKVLENQVKELDKEDARIKRKIDYFKDIAKTVPEEAHRVQGDIDALTQQLTDVRNKKVPLRAEIKKLKERYAYLTSSGRLRKKAEAINEPSDEPKPKRTVNKAVSFKRQQSRSQLLNQQDDEKMENLYNTIMKDGYLLISKGAELRLVGGKRKKVHSISGKVYMLQDYLKKAHPDKKVKYQLVARKRREWGQLDDVEYCDLKVMIVDNNTISFSPEDLPTDMSNY